MGGVPIRAPHPFALLLFPLLFCRARQLISLFLNSFRTLCQNTLGGVKYDSSATASKDQAMTFTANSPFRFLVSVLAATLFALPALVYPKRIFARGPQQAAPD